MSKTKSKPSGFTSLSLGPTNFASTYFEHSFNLNLLGSDIVIFKFSLIFESINEHNKPMAPAP